MINHFFKLAIRNFVRTRAYTVINIIGLSLGLTVALLLFEWMKFENSYDRFHENRNRIFRVITGQVSAEDSWVGTPAQLAPILLDNIPEIERFVRLDNRIGVARANGKSFYDEKIFLADSSFFDVFSFRLVSGNAKTAFRNPESVIITESISQKYFGGDDPVGQLFVIDDHNYIVSGIAEDPPENSHFHFDFLLRFEPVHNKDDCWGCFNYSTYLLMKKKSDLPAVENKIRQLSVIQGQEKITLNFASLQPLTDIHYEYIRGNFEPVFSRTYMLGYSLTIIIILILACINYINLNVAITPLRFKEVGVKKAFGAGSLVLRFQFLLESILAVVISVILAMILSELSLPAFNRLTERNLHITFLKPEIFLMISGFSIILGLIIGIYPAIISGNVSVLRVLKSTGLPVSKSRLRNILVFFQLAISIGFFTCTLIFNKQMNFIRHADLGFDKDQILNVDLHPTNINSMEDYTRYRQRCIEFKNNMTKYNEIASASINTFQPGTLNRNHSIRFPGQNKNQEMSMFVIAGDRDFAKTFNIKIIAGEDKIRNFEDSGTEGYVINESALKALGWTDALDREFSIYGERAYGRIIGICSDFNYRSLHHKIGPAVIVIGEPGMMISMKLTGSNIAQAIETVKKDYKAYFLNSPFDYSFFDQDFDSMYKSEIKITNTAGLVTVLSLVIACLGMYGLTSYYTIQRKKEIGVRKVFGASNFRIIWIFMKELGGLIILALIVMIPVSVYFLKSWLSNFAYRTSLSWWIFLVVGFLIFMISWLTILYQTLRAAKKNPVETLRYE